MSGYTDYMVFIAHHIDHEKIPGKILHSFLIGMLFAGAPKHRVFRKTPVLFNYGLENRND